MAEIRERYEGEVSPIVISGCIGPQGDGYRPDSLMRATEAEDYHAAQIATFADTEADMATAITMTSADEAIGIARAAAAAGLPVAISFTVETDGRLPSASRSARRSSRSTRRPRPRPPTTWSTALTRRTSTTS